MNGTSVLDDALSESQYGYGFLSDDSPPTDQINSAMNLSIDPHIYKRIVTIGSNRLNRPMRQDMIRLKYYPLNVNCDDYQEYEWSGRIGGLEFEQELPLGVQLVAWTMSEKEENHVIINRCMPAGHSYIDRHLIHDGHQDEVLKTLPDLDRELKSNYKKIIEDETRSDELCGLYTSTKLVEPQSEWLQKISSLPFPIASRSRQRSRKIVSHWDETHSPVENIEPEIFIFSVILDSFTPSQKVDDADDHEVFWWNRGKGRRSANGMIVSALICRLDPLTVDNLDSVREELMLQIRQPSSKNELNDDIKSLLYQSSGAESGVLTSLISPPCLEVVSSCVMYEGVQCLWNVTYAYHSHEGGGDGEYESTMSCITDLPPPDELFRTLQLGLSTGDVVYISSGWILVCGPVRRRNILSLPNPINIDDLNATFEVQTMLPKAIASGDDLKKLIPDDKGEMKWSSWMATDFRQHMRREETPIMRHDPGTKFRVLLRAVSLDGAVSRTALIQVCIGGHYGRIPPIIEYLLQSYLRLQLPCHINAFNEGTSSIRPIKHEVDICPSDDLLRLNILGLPPPKTIARHKGSFHRAEDELEIVDRLDHHPPTVDWAVLTAEETEVFTFGEETADYLNRSYLMYCPATLHPLIPPIYQRLRSSDSMDWKSMVQSLFDHNNESSEDVEYCGFDICLLDGIGIESSFDEENLTSLNTERLAVHRVGGSVQVSYSTLPKLIQLCFLKRSAVHKLIRSKMMMAAWYVIKEVLSLISRIKNEHHLWSRDTKTGPGKVRKEGLMSYEIPTFKEMDENEVGVTSDDGLSILCRVIEGLELVIKSNLAQIVSQSIGSTLRTILTHEENVLNGWPCHVVSLNRYVDACLKLGETELAEKRLIKAKALTDVDEVKFECLHNRIKCYQLKTTNDQKLIYQKMFD
eukprot:GHVH01009263.1.p1 GENE.GHVH01009263.1~~GHVH01009263.1.p1  ORF type:complete len:919 (+),score=128.97 GHVH01009263.1:30-2786(+)